MQKESDNMDKLETKTEIIKAMKILECIDTTNYQKRKHNQEQVNKAYNILDKLKNNLQEVQKIDYY